MPARTDSPEYADFGGGFGIDYGDGKACPPGDFARAALLLEAGRLRLVVEPGRSIVGPYGALVSKVNQLKKGAALLGDADAGMNDILRRLSPSRDHREHR